MNLFVKYSGARYYLLLHPVCGTEEQSGRGGDSYLVPATHRYKSSQDEVEVATWSPLLTNITAVRRRWRWPPGPWYSQVQEQSGRGGDDHLVPVTHRYKNSQDEV